MDLLSLFIGLGIGILGGIALTFAMNKGSKASKADLKAAHTESELKAILAAQAKTHLDSSKQIVAELSQRCNQLSTQLQNYEQSLVVNEASDDNNESFFGEHASVFLRNSPKTPSKVDVALASPDAPPRDFANNGSGVFSGAPVASKD